MRALMADADVRGQFQVLIGRLISSDWCELWLPLKLSVRTFAEMGLISASSDAEVWRKCQSEQILLITGNRNYDGPESLEATLRSELTLESLPVFTLADPQRILNDRHYVEETVESLLEHLLDIDNYRGVGRIYIP